MVNQRLLVTHPLDELTKRLDSIAQEVSSFGPDDEEKFLHLLNEGSCAPLRDYWVEAVSNILLLRCYHKAVSAGLINSGAMPRQIACWAVDTVRLETVIELLDNIDV